MTNSYLHKREEKGKGNQQTLKYPDIQSNAGSPPADTILVPSDEPYVSAVELVEEKYLVRFSSEADACAHTCAAHCLHYRDTSGAAAAAAAAAIVVCLTLILTLAISFFIVDLVEGGRVVAAAAAFAVAA